METNLRRRICSHLQASPGCMPVPAITKFAAEASRLNALLLRNQNIVQFGRTGDAEEFFSSKGPSTAYQCNGCQKIFNEAGKATKHIRNVESCNGSEVTEIFCRSTVFGTLCPPPASNRRRVITPVPMAVSFDTVESAVVASADIAANDNMYLDDAASTAFTPTVAVTPAAAGAPTAAAPTAAAATAAAATAAAATAAAATAPGRAAVHLSTVSISVYLNFA